MSTNLTSILPYVLPHVAACPQPLALQAVNSALIEFCNETMMYQSLETQDVTAGVQEYSLSLPVNTRIVKVLGVWHLDNWLEPVSVESVRSGLVLRGAVGTATPTSNTPTSYFMKSPTDTAFQLFPIPAETVTLGLLVRAAYRPSRTGSVVEDEIFHNWVEVLAAGALYRLLSMPSQPFYNPASAGVYYKTFSSGCRSASIKARSGSVAASSSVAHQRFA